MKMFNAADALSDAGVDVSVARNAGRAALLDSLRGLSDGAPHLADGDGPRFLNAVALRVAPPRSGGGDKAPAKAAPKPPASTPNGPTEHRLPASPGTRPEPEQPARSPLQRLADRFR